MRGQCGSIVALAIGELVEHIAEHGLNTKGMEHRGIAFFVAELLDTALE
jgi:hypothetical protein